MKPPFVRNAYNYDTMLASDETALHTPEPTRTRQEFKDECDINNILRQFAVTGQLPQSVRIPLDGDFAEIGNFQDAMNTLRQAEEAFMEMPSNVRKRFNNDPGEFIDFFSKEENRDEGVKLGLVLPTAKMEEREEKAASKGGGEGKPLDKTAGN